MVTEMTFYGDWKQFIKNYFNYDPVTWMWNKSQ